MGDAAAVQFGPQPLPCAVDLPRALRYLGQRREGLPEHLGQRLQEAADQCASAARPRGVGRAYPLLWGGPGRPVELAGTGVALPGADKLLGIHVGPSLLMTPMKSVTAVVGLAPLAGPKARDTERR